MRFIPTAVRAFSIHHPPHSTHKVLFRMEPAFWVLKVEEFRVRDIPNERIELRVKITYAQRQSLNLVRSRPLFFIFNGEVDHNFLPNGIGQWRDSDKNGEFLNGHWKHGLPEAPFQSREYRVSRKFSVRGLASSPFMFCCA